MPPLDEYVESFHDNPVMLILVGAAFIGIIVTYFRIRGESGRRPVRALYIHLGIAALTYFFWLWCGWPMWAPIAVLTSVSVALCVRRLFGDFDPGVQ